MANTQCIFVAVALVLATIPGMHCLPIPKAAAPKPGVIPVVGAKSPPPPPMAYACVGVNCRVFINAGELTPRTDSLGITWKADTAFLAGTAEKANFVGTASYGREFLYKTHRVGDFSYAIPVAQGYHQVTLHFAETWHGEVGKRVFNVSIQGVRVLPKFDIFAEAKMKNKAVMKSFVTYTSNKLLMINLTKVVDNAKINAIEIYATKGGYVSPPPPRPPTPPPRSPPRSPSPPLSPPPPPFSPPPSPMQRPSGNVYQINAGSNAAKMDALNKTWAIDAYYKNGAIYKSPANVKILGAANGQEFLYTTARQGPAFEYTLPVKAPGHYTLFLFFSEPQYAAIKKRLMNVFVENVKVLTNLDIFGMVGQNTALSYQFHVQTFKSNITIAFNATLGAATVSALSVRV